MPVSQKAGDILRGRYQINRIIGKGGMGSIYLADDLRLEGRQCALKEVEHDRSLPAELLDEAREQFFREATVLARLDQPNLPKVSDFFSIEDRDYLVMDFVPGKDLRALMLEAKQKKEFLNEADVVNWADQLSEALTYLHEQDPPILHRDIKPSNLKLTPSGLLKLVDFGLVKVLAPGEVTITILQGQGTALYTPLEQYGGDSAHTDVRTDIYAFGATLYHLLTSTAPAVARERFLNPGCLTPMRQINSAVSPRLERAVHWAMNLHPDERPASVAEFRKSLRGNMPMRRANQIPLSVWEVLGSPTERTLLIAAVGMGFLSLIATFVF